MEILNLIGVNELNMGDLKVTGHILSWGDDFTVSKDLGGIACNSIASDIVEAGSFTLVDASNPNITHEVFNSPEAGRLNFGTAFSTVHANTFDCGNVRTHEISTTADATLLFDGFSAIDFGGLPIVGAEGFPSGGGGSQFPVVDNAYVIDKDISMIGQRLYTAMCDMF